MRTYKWITAKTALRKIAIELLCPSIVAKGQEYTVSENVRQLNIDNFTAACNGEVQSDPAYPDVIVTGTSV